MQREVTFAPIFSYETLHGYDGADWVRIASVACSCLAHTAANI